MFFAWLQSRRRRNLLAQPFPDQWVEWIDENVRLARSLPEAHRLKLHDLVKVFVGEKHWEGCGGLELTDEMRVTIAAQACLLVLGFEHNYYFDRVESILVYPGAYVHQDQSWHGSVVVEQELSMLGEHHHRGPIVLSWSHVLEGGRNPRDGHNLVLHEFAHHIDGLAGDMDGVPPLASRELNRRWCQVTDAEHRRLVHESRRGQRTLLDWYGSTNKAEFFAVATECFFEQPQAMRERHPELYEAFRGFYQQDPAELEF